MEFDAVAVRVGDPGLPALVFAELRVADLHPRRAKPRDHARQVVDLEAEVAEGLPAVPRFVHALEQLDILASQGLPGEQFNWVHAQHADISFHIQAVQRGAYIGFDNLKPADEEHYLSLVLDALDAGLAERILLSHDNGWYRPGEPDGGASQVRGFTYLVYGFLPRLRRRGVGPDLIRLMTETNPARAFRMRAD